MIFKKNEILIVRDMEKKDLRKDIEENIASMESQMDTVYNAPVTEGGMEYLMEHQDEITFCESQIEEDLDLLDLLEDEDEDEFFREFFRRNNGATKKDGIR